MLFSSANLMKLPFKKIDVCVGATCGPRGARTIKAFLERIYGGEDVEISERECCGRCADSNSIVIDESTVVSRLSVDSLAEQFTDRPDEALQAANVERTTISKQIDRLLESGELL